MFKNAVDLFDIFGFKIKVDPSWLLIAALIVWNLSTAYFPEYLPELTRYDYIALSVVAMLGLFGSLILHELAHSLVARLFDLKVGGITLFIFGGVAELEQEPRDPKSEFWIAIAGPTLSFALAGLAYTAANLFETEHSSQPLFAVVNYLALINLVLAVFNLIPAFPLDGGRIFRAMLWHFKKDLLGATRIASNFGTFFAFVLILIGMLSLFSNLGIAGLWQILIGFFILTASRGSYQQLLVKTAMKDQTVRSLMTKAPITADADDTIESVVENVMLKQNVSFVPINEGDHLLGYVDAQVIQKIDRDNWSSTHVADIYISSCDENTVPPDTPTEILFEKMASGGQRKFLIAENSTLLGVISLSDLLTFLAIRQGLGIKSKYPRLSADLVTKA